MRARYYCPGCLTAREFSGEESGPQACESCGRKFAAAFENAVGEKGLERCVFCGNRAFFLQRDFDQRLGCLLMAISLAIALYIGWRFGWIWFTPVLLATVVVDWIIAARIGTVTICYRCDAEYRDLPLNPRHRGWNTHVAERYAAKKTLRRML